jgi:hypothetical protein
VPGLVHPVHTFSRLSDVSEEVYNARVWAGIHYRFSAVDGAKLGRAVATYVANRYFRCEHGRRARRPGSLGVSIRREVTLHFEVMPIGCVR